MHKSLSAVFNGQSSVQADICEHLTRLLNARRGSVPGLPDYGLPEFLSIFRCLPDGLHDFLNMIQRVIERYEPRLKNINVKLLSERDMSEMLRVLIHAEDVFHRTMSFRATLSQCDGVAVH